MKMHQLTQPVGGYIRDIFTDRIMVEKPERPPFLSLIIGRVRNSKISKSNIQLEVNHELKLLFMKTRKERI